MAEYSLLRFLVIMLVINVGLGLFDWSVSSYNEDYEGMIDFSNSPAAAYTNGSLSYGFFANESDADIDAASSLDPETGNVFTDAWSSMKGWFNKQQGRFSLLTSMFNQPGGMLKDIGVPQELVTAFQFIWWAIMSLLFVAFLRGGNA